MSISTLTPSKQQLLQLIEKLSEDQANAMLAFAHVLSMDPISRAIMFAPYDDEPITDEEEERVQQALADPRPDVPLEEIREELGL